MVRETPCGKEFAPRITYTARYIIVCSWPGTIRFGAPDRQFGGYGMRRYRIAVGFVIAVVALFGGSSVSAQGTDQPEAKPAVKTAGALTAEETVKLLMGLGYEPEKVNDST